MQYLVLNSDDEVENTIVADEGFTLPGKRLIPLEEGMAAGKGWKLKDGKLVNPNPPQPQEPRVKSWTPLAFKELFTLEERKALRRFAKNDELAEDWLDLLNASSEVKADDPRTIGGLQYMVAKGILAQSRMEAILSS